MTAQVGWTLLTQPAFLNLPSVAADAQAGEQVVIQGRAIIRPFQRDLKNDIANSYGQRAIQSNVGQILGTIAQGPTHQGELPWRTDFGSWLALLRQRLNDETLVEQARVFVVQAIQRWEPRVRVRRVDVLRPKTLGEADRTTLRCTYSIVDSTGRVIVDTLANDVILEG